MGEFSFFVNEDHPVLALNSGTEAYYNSKQALREYHDLRSAWVREETRVLRGVRAVLSSGAGMGRILKHLEDQGTDVAFISAFLTGEDPEAGGYGGYADGESDSRGGVHEAGERVSTRENRLRNKSLSAALAKAGYGFIRVDGDYGAPEESFCVINVVEDFDQFESVMHRLGNEFGQDSVLMCPRDGLPYFYKFDGTKDASIASRSPRLLETAVEKYFTQVKGKKFAFPMSSGFRFSEVPDVPWARSSLSPVRQGYACVGVEAYRKELLSGKDFSLFGRYEQFSEAVRKVVPDFVGDPVSLGFSGSGVAFIRFEFTFLSDSVYLCFLWNLADGSVSVSFDKSDAGGEMTFNSLPELAENFQEWFQAVLRSGYEG
jgi:hypothetical protein